MITRARKGEKIYNKLGNTWKKVHAKSDEELGIDREFTRLYVRLLVV
jgi:hypothetical protein